MYLGRLLCRLSYLLGRLRRLLGSLSSGRLAAILVYQVVQACDMVVPKSIYPFQIQ